MAEKVVTTSSVYNEDLEYFKGVSHGAVWAGLLGVVVAALVLPSVEVPVGGLKALVWLCSFFVPFTISQRARSGQYRFENWERFLRQAMSFTGRKKEVFDLKDSAPLVLDQDKDTVLHGYLGTQIICYRIGYEREEALCKDFALLLMRLPAGNRLQFFRVSKSASLEGEALSQVNECDLYVVLESLPDKIPQANHWKKEVLQVLSVYGSKVSAHDTAKLFSSIVYGREPDSWELSDSIWRSPLAAAREEALLHVGAIEKRALVLSLAKLPEKVGFNFQKVYSILSRLPGSISVKFEGRGTENPINSFLKSKKIEKSGKKDLDIGQSDRVFVDMSMHVLLHGHPDQLEDLAIDLGRDLAFFEPEERPIFSRESVYIKKALSSLLPGNSDFAVRKFQILSAKEATFYIPLPVKKGKKDSLIPMRSDANSLYGFDLSLNHPLYIWADVGQGKSALMSKILLSHIRKGSKEFPTASFSFESGGTFQFLRGSLADVEIILERKAGSYQPLTHQPLRLFSAFGEVGRARALEWLCGLMAIKPSDEVLRQFVQVGLEAVLSRNTYRLVDLLGELELMAEEGYLNGSPESVVEEKLKKLSVFSDVKTGRYGQIFDPKPDDSPPDYSQVKHFYVSQLKSTSEAPELLSAFYSLGIYLLSAVEHRFEPDAKQSAPLLVQIDELHLLATYLGWDTLRQLNSQGRKQRKLLVAASQSLSDSVKEGSDKNRFELIESFGHFFFAGSVAEPGHLLKALGKHSDDGRIYQEFERVLEHTRELRRAKKGYAWGYIEPGGQMQTLMVDLEQEEKWLVATHAASQTLRARVMRDGGYNYWQACALLAKYGPRELPVDKDPTETQVKIMLDNMMRHESE